MYKSKYFTDKEIECKCGCGFIIKNEELLMRLDILRERIGRPVIINSWCRCKKHNLDIGGSLSSSHLGGFAVDIKCKDDNERFEIVESAIYAGFKRIGIYKRNFIHIDMDKEKLKDRNIDSSMWVRD